MSLCRYSTNLSWPFIEEILLLSCQSTPVLPVQPTTLRGWLSTYLKLSCNRFCSRVAANHDIAISCVETSRRPNRWIRATDVDPPALPSLMRQHSGCCGRALCDRSCSARARLSGRSARPSPPSLLLYIRGGGLGGSAAQ